MEKVNPTQTPVTDRNQILCS